MKLRLVYAGAMLAILGPTARAVIVFDEVAPLFTRVDGTVIVPAELSGRLFFVQAMINGHGPFRLVVDTGCSFSLVSPEVAEAVGAHVGLVTDSERIAVNSFGHPADVPRVLLDSIQLGAARFEGVYAGVSDTFATLARTGRQRVDGALGYSLFSELVLTLDFPARRVVLSHDRPTNLPPVQAELALTAPDDVPLVTVQLQGQSLELEIDSGATDSLQIPFELANALDWRYEPRPGSLVAAVGENARALVGRLNGPLCVGAVQTAEPIAMLTGGKASLGIGFLQHFCVVFDPGQGRLSLCAADPGPARAAPLHSVGLSLEAATAGWRVIGVIPGSPAEGSGVSAGDLITLIEGQPAVQWSRDQLDHWIDTRSTVALQVFGGSSPRDLVLRVWSLVP
jgi:predicted aspartyl protease